MFSSKLPHSFVAGRRFCGRGGSRRNERYSENCRGAEEIGPAHSGFAQLERLGKSLMLPIAELPAAGSCCDWSPDLLGRIDAPVIGPFFQAMSAAGDAGSPMSARFSPSAWRSDSPTRPTVRPRWQPWWAHAGGGGVQTMSPIVSPARSTRPATRPRSTTASRGDRCRSAPCVALPPLHTIQLPTSSDSWGKRSCPSWCRWPPVPGFAMSYFYPIFDAGLTGLGQFIGGSGAFGAFIYGFANRTLIPSPPPHPELIRLVPLRRLSDPGRRDRYR